MMEVKQVKNQKEAAFRFFFEAYLASFTPGVQVSGPHEGHSLHKARLVFDTAHRLCFYHDETYASYFLLKRRIPFNDAEKSFLESVLPTLYLLMDVPLRDVMPHALPMRAEMEAGLEAAIAGFISPEAHEAIAQVIALYKRWGQHNGPHLLHGHSMGILLDKTASHNKDAQNNVLNQGMETYVQGMCCADDTLLVIDSDGFICDVQSLASKGIGDKKQESIFAPLGVSHFAQWASNRNKVLIHLTGEGHILVLADKKLLFARYKGVWRSFPHTFTALEALLPQISVEEAQTLQAVYLTALDIAFSRCSACFAFLPEKKDRYKGVREEYPSVACFPMAFSGAPAILTKKVQGKRFFEIPRKIRLDLSLIEGAIMLDRKGNILRAGLPVSAYSSQVARQRLYLALKTMNRSRLGFKINGERGHIEFMLP